MAIRCALKASSEAFVFLLPREWQDTPAKTGLALPSSESFPSPECSRLSGAEVALEAHLQPSANFPINRKGPQGGRRDGNQSPSDLLFLPSPFCLQTNKAWLHLSLQELPGGSGTPSFGARGGAQRGLRRAGRPEGLSSLPGCGWTPFPAGDMPPASPHPGCDDTLRRGQTVNTPTAAVCNGVLGYKGAGHCLSPLSLFVLFPSVTLLR